MHCQFCHAVVTNFQVANGTKSIPGSGGGKRGHKKSFAANGPTTEKSPGGEEESRASIGDRQA